MLFTEGMFALELDASKLRRNPLVLGAGERLPFMPTLGVEGRAVSLSDEVKLDEVDDSVMGLEIEP